MSLSLRDRQLSSPAVFIDRDGVLIADVGYICEKERTRFLHANINALAELQERVVLVTNQAGVAHGHFSEEEVQKYHDWLVSELRLQSLNIFAVYYCPHHPAMAGSRYGIACNCRKPNPGMLFQAGRNHGIDMSASVMVGDKPTDIEAGLSAGVGDAVLLDPVVEKPYIGSVHGRREELQCWLTPDLRQLELSALLEILRDTNP